MREVLNESVLERVKTKLSTCKIKKASLISNKVRYEYVARLLKTNLKAITNRITHSRVALMAFFLDTPRALHSKHLFKQLRINVRTPGQSDLSRPQLLHPLLKPVQVFGFKFPNIPRKNSPCSSPHTQRHTQNQFAINQPIARLSRNAPVSTGA